MVQQDGNDRLHRTQIGIRPGEILGVAGACGAGKTTLLAVFAGLLKPDRGQVMLEGRDVTRRLDRLRALSGYVGHEFHGPLDVSPTSWLDLWGEFDGVPRKVREPRVEQAMRRFNLEGQPDRVADCSSGFRKRLSLARLWVSQPSLMILDQPSEGLDGHGLRALSEALREAAANGHSIVFSDSSPHLPISVCDRVVLLQNGTVSAVVSRHEPHFETMIAESQGWAQ